MRTPTLTFLCATVLSALPGVLSAQGDCFTFNGPPLGVYATNNIEYAIRVTAPAGGMQVSGFRLLSDYFATTGTADSTTIDTALYLASGNVPSASPARQSTMTILRGVPNFYLTSFASPVSIASGQSFYIAFRVPLESPECDFHLPISPNATPVTTDCFRPLSGGSWYGPVTTRSWIFTVVCSVNPPVASFTATPLSGPEDLLVQFMDQSSGNPTSWRWDFTSDGTWDAFVQDPTKTYTSPGLKSVTLEVTNAGGSATVTRTDYINVVAVTPPVPAFSATPLSGLAQLDVQFTDQSTGNPTGWKWDFSSDGTWDAFVKNPSKTYGTPGLKSVTLEVTNDGGSQSLTKTDYIQVIAPPPPVAEFSATPLAVCVDFPVQFTDLSTGNPSSWKWDFSSDGTWDSFVQHPAKTYGNPGLKSVTLEVTNATSTATLTKVSYINVGAAPVASITGSPRSGPTPLTVSFTGPAAASWAWDFDGDGLVDSTLQNPIFTYVDPGDYSVELTATNPPGCKDSHTEIDYVQVELAVTNTLSPEVVQFQFNEVQGTEISNTASTKISPEFADVDNSTWHADPGRAWFKGNEPGAGCLGRNASAPPVARIVPLEDVAGSYTIMWWQRMGPTGPGSGSGSKVYFCRVGDMTCFTGGSSAAHKMACEFSDGGNDYVSTTHVQSSPDSWMHVALVVDAQMGIAQWYFDGVADASTWTSIGSGGLNLVGSAIRVGGYSQNYAGGPSDRPSTLFYDLDDFRIYSHARTPEQILEDMQSEVATTSRFGSSCQGPGEAPQIAVNGAPSLGNEDFQVKLFNAEPGRMVALVIGAGAKQWNSPAGLVPLPYSVSGIFGPGCNVNVAASVPALESETPDYLLASTGNGTIDMEFPISSLMFSKGDHLYLQWIVFGSSGALTEGLDVNIQ